MSAERVKVGTNGCLVIPSKLRKETGIMDGVIVLMDHVNGELRVRSMKKAFQDAQERLKPYLAGKRSMADELIADRRTEANKE